LFKSLNIKSKEVSDTLFNSPKNGYKDKITADIIAKIIETIAADNSDKELTNKLINKLIKLYKETTQKIELHLLLKQLDDSEFELIKRLIPPKLTMKIIVCKISITRFLISEQDIAYSYKTMTQEGMDNIVADFLWQLAIKKLKSGIAALAFTYLTSALIYYFASLPYVAAIAMGNAIGMIVYLPLLAFEGTLYDYYQPEIKQISLIENLLTPLLTLSALAIIFAPYFAINAAPYIVTCCVLAYLLIINTNHKEEAKYLEANISNKVANSTQFKGTYKNTDSLVNDPKNKLKQSPTNTPKII
ncbi:MAG: hypothetical protein HON42_02310, partial [Alphaproteobacteria bacterium]|nr:hypothetical protein [Alphaproteobacteria bacterium]